MPTEDAAGGEAGAGDQGKREALPEALPLDDLGERELPIVEDRGPWMRMHSVQHDPVFFGKTGLGRFDDPEGEYGVLYAAEDAFGAFVESFGRAPGRNVVSWQKLRNRPLSRIRVGSRVGPLETGASASDSLRLVDLTGAGLARLGATSVVSSGPYTAAQRWSRTLYEHPERPDGIFYRLKHDPSRKGVAIFERAAGLGSEFFGTLIAPEQAKLLAAVLDEYGFGLVGGAPTK